MQWLLYLTRFDFVLYYHLGNSIDKPNTLSQRLDYGNGLYDNEDIVLFKLEYLAVKGTSIQRKEYSFLIDIY